MTYEFGPYALRESDLILLEDGVPLPLGPKVVATLLVLLQRPGQTVVKDELLARVWPEGFAEEGSLTQNIHLLRKAFRARLGRDVIETLPRRGYRVMEQVKQSPDFPPVLPRPTPLKRSFMSISIAAACFAVAVGAMVFYKAHRTTFTLNPIAQKTYTLARLHAESRKPLEVAQSIQEFQRVITLAPTNPLGYSGLAESYTMETFWCKGKRDCDVQARLARDAAARAMHYGAETAEAHTALAFISSAIDRDEPRAEEEFRRAIELNRKYPAAHLWYGTLLFQRGNFEAAASELEQAAALEPRAPMITAMLGRAYLYSARYRDAVAMENAIVQQGPPSTDALVTLGIAYDALGMYADAERSFDAISDSSARLRREILRAREAALQGRRLEAQKTLSQARLNTKGGKISGASIRDRAALELALGDKSGALAQVQGLRGIPRLFVLADPRLRPIRNGLVERKISAL